jgi:glycerol-3-phosphate acyltransferase PlsX
MKIIIDAMGGDNAPAEIVRGAAEAVREFGVSVILVGRQEEIRACLDREDAAGLGDKIGVVHASELVAMEDDPTTVLRTKKDSSMSVALRLLRDGAGDACISAGSTGALLAGATLIVKRIGGIRRAALAPVLPNGDRGVMLIDCGANVDCTPEYLLQFAFMGSFYAKHILGCPDPRVGLLNVGTEETKGGGLQNETFRALKEAHANGNLNFIGNIEARDVLFNTVDVVVADGFAGNVMLKTIEGTSIYIMNNLKEIFTANRRSKVAAFTIKKRLEEFRKKVDPSEVGGTALLGISRPVIKAHGSADARALKNAVLQAVHFVQADVPNEIAKNISHMVIGKAE